MIDLFAPVKGPLGPWIQPNLPRLQSAASNAMEFSTLEPGFGGETSGFSVPWPVCRQWVCAGRMQAAPASFQFPPWPPPCCVTLSKLLSLSGLWLFHLCSRERDGSSLGEGSGWREGRPLWCSPHREAGGWGNFSRLQKSHRALLAQLLPFANEEQHMLMIPASSSLLGWQNLFKQDIIHGQKYIEEVQYIVMIHVIKLDQQVIFIMVILINQIIS